MVVRPEGAVKVDVVKRKVIALWLHFFLNRIGSKHPEFLLALLDDLNVSNRHKIIIKSRYIDKLKFKQIPGVKGVNPSTVVTGSPLPFTITINGSTAQLYNKYHLPIYSNRLCPRKRYCGAYVNNGTDAWVVLFNTPDCPQFASA